MASFLSKTLSKKFALILFVLLMILSSFWLNDQAKAATGINQQINFQGKVVNTDGTNVADGDYDFEFKLYTVDTAGTAIWTETRTTVNQVTVTDGIFRVSLGSVTALPGSVDFNTDNIYLGINFNSDGEMTPRVRFSAVPYAFNALKVAGLTVTNTTGTLTIPDATTITYSGANDTTFTTTGTTTVTLPTTGTLSTQDGSETLTNKTIGSTGLTFSGATTDITTATNEALTLTAAGTGDIVFSLDNDTNFQISPTFTSTTSQDAISLSLTNQTASGTQRGFALSNANDAANAVTESLIFLDNAETTASTLTDAILITSSGVNDGIVDGLDVSDGNITNAINIGANAIAGTNFSVTGAGAITGISLNAGSGTIQTSGSILGSAIDQSSAGALTIGNTTATSLSLCNSTACDTITIGTNADADTITIGDSTDGFSINSTGLNVTTAGAITGVSTFSSSGDWTWSATTPTITINSTESFTISDGTDSFVINTSGSLFSFSDGSNGFTFDADSGPSYTGTARPTRRIVLSPEYSGATLTAFYGAGTDASVTGAMTADVENTAADGLRTYYEWSSSQGSLNYYTVVVRVQLPPDFSSWATSNALQVDFTSESTSTTNNTLDAYVYLSSDSTTAVASDTTNAAASAEAWEQITIDDSVLDDASAPEWDAAGETAVIYLRMGSLSNNFVRVGDITLNYVSSY